MTEYKYSHAGSVKAHKDSMPLVTVIVAVFNGCDTLQQCIDSVVRQSYPNRELIIIDGGSTDGTVELIRNNSEWVAYWVSAPDRGVYHAWNKGLDQACGEWICFLGADDYFWDEAVLERIVSELREQPESVCVAYGQIMLIGSEGEPSRLHGESWEQAKVNFHQYMTIPHCGTMHRRSLFELRGKFDDSFHIAGDYELLLRELPQNDAKFLSGIVVVGHRLGGISTAPTNYRMVLQETWRAQRMHGFWFPGRYIRKELTREYLLWLLWKVCGERFARWLLDLRRRMRGLPSHWTRT